MIITDSHDLRYRSFSRDSYEDDRASLLSEDDVASIASEHDFSIIEDDAGPVEAQVKEVAKRTFCAVAKDFLKGLWKSRVLRAVILTVGAALALFFLASNPLGWATAIFGLTLALIGLTYLVAMKIMWKKFYFEASAIGRMLGLKGENHHEIRFTNWDQDHAKIYLGALPNELWHREGEVLLNQRKIGALLSINQPWEREHLGFSMPYSDRYWTDHLGENNFRSISTKDHTLLSVEAMDEAADFIHDQIQAGNNVYIHCRAGQSRSAAAIAAYLIKYGMMDGAIDDSATIDDISKVIKDSRSISRIHLKKPSLVRYCDYLRDQGYYRLPEVSTANRQESDNHWAKKAKKAKKSRAVITE